MLASTVSPWLERIFGSIILTHYFYENADRNADSKKKKAYCFKWQSLSPHMKLEWNNMAKLQ
jgi:hypothetical protein